MTNSSAKKVSVIIPNYNYARYLKKRLKSILRQTYPIYELIILDDCSGDNSASVIEDALPKIQEQYPDLKVKFIKNSTNSGKAIKQWIKGFEFATGDFIWIAEADDLSKPNFLETAMSGFNDKAVVLSYTESAIINKHGFIIMPNFRHSRDKERTGHYKQDYIKSGQQEISEILAIRCSIPNVSGVIFKKDKSIPYIKYLKEALKFSQVGDWYFYAKILKHGKISYHHQALNYFRVHSDSTTRKSQKHANHFHEIQTMHQLFIHNYALDDQTKAKIQAEELRVKTKHMV